MVGVRRGQGGWVRIGEIGWSGGANRGQTGWVRCGQVACCCMRFCEMQGGLTMGNFDFARQGQLVNIEDYGKIAISVTTL